MPTIDELFTTFINELAPSFIQLLMLLMAFLGSYVIALSIYQLYRTQSADSYSSSQSIVPISGSLIRIMLGGLLVTPSVTLWRAADAFLQGGGRTASEILAYIDGDGEPSSYCQNFGDAIQLVFMAGGLIACIVAWRHADDQSKGLDPRGYRVALGYLVGGVLCFFITDLIGIFGNTFDMNWGFDELCAAFDDGDG